MPATMSPRPIQYARQRLMGPRVAQLQVRGFDGSVNDTESMGFVECVGNLQGQAQRLAHG